jgi:predicted CopG family antitoxin
MEPQKKIIKGKHIVVDDEVYSFLNLNTQGKETYNETLRRLLKLEVKHE